MTEGFRALQAGRRRRMTRRLARHPARAVQTDTAAQAREAQEPREPRERRDTPTEELMVDAYTELNASELEEATPQPASHPASPRTTSAPPPPPPEALAQDLSLRQLAQAADEQTEDSELSVEMLQVDSAQPEDDPSAELNLELANDTPEPTTLTHPAIDDALRTSTQAPAFSPIAHSASVAPPTSARGDQRDQDDNDLQTRPRIRLPDGGSLRPSPPSAAGGERAARSPLPPAPTKRSSHPAPTGEGIVRASLRALANSNTGRDSDLPTSPRIPLTHDMALAAGRITSQEVMPYPGDAIASARARLSSLPPPNPDEPAPAVLVSRAHVISDRPPGVESTRTRRVRPESDDFETLDLDDTVAEGDLLRLEKPAGKDREQGEPLGQMAADALGAVRVTRTPPPPPAQSAGGKRNITVTTGVPAALQQARGAERPAPPPPPPPSVAAAKKAPATGPKTRTTKKRAWWEVLFSDDYVRTLPKPSPVAVAKQVAFMESSLGIKRGDAVLDVGCGLGQHALEFARRGYLVVALDLALSMITRAAEEAQQRGLRINFLHKDIRDIGFEGTFDAIVCVGTTFGFFDDEQNRGVITRLAHALKPGGRLLLEVVNRDFVITSQPNLVWFEGEGCVVMEESDFNFYSSRLTVKRTMMRDDGRQSDIEYNIRLYSVHELGQMLKQAGFSIKEVSGQEATRGLFFGAQSTRIIILAERKPRARGKDELTTPSNDAT